MSALFYSRELEEVSGWSRLLLVLGYFVEFFGAEHVKHIRLFLFWLGLFAKVEELGAGLLLWHKRPFRLLLHRLA